MSSSPLPSLVVRPLAPPDWSWLEGWFRDRALHAALGPVDEKWVREVLRDDTGVELVVETARGPSALVGIVWDPERKRHVISSLAADPSHRRRGIGRMALRAAIEWPHHPPAAGWTAFVEPDNADAAAFFTAIGWRDLGLDDGMVRFVDPGTATVD